MPETLGHALPPYLGWVRTRRRIWWPELHGFEHEDQGPHAAILQCWMALQWPRPRESFVSL